MIFTPLFSEPSLQTSKLSVREDRPGFSSPARFAQVSTEEGGEVEGGGGTEEEGMGGVRLGHEGVGGEGKVRQVGGQGRIGILCQGPHQAPLLHREIRKYLETAREQPTWSTLSWSDLARLAWQNSLVGGIGISQFSALWGYKVSVKSTRTLLGMFQDNFKRNGLYNYYI